MCVSVWAWERVCMWIYVSVSMCCMCVCWCREGKKKASDPLELELHELFGLGPLE